MKRTIKFRAKTIKGRWVYGDLLHYTNPLVSTAENDGAIIVIDYKSKSDNSFKIVYPDTVGQFTGLLDKNGKEIWEGDIIGCSNPDIKHLIFYNEKQGRFMAALNGDIENDFVGVCGLDDSRWNASKEVIGNVYDNPELLKL